MHVDSMKFTCRLAGVALFLLLTTSTMGANPQLLTHIAEIRELSHQEAVKKFPVHVRGVATWCSPNNSYFFIQDDSGGISVLVDEARRLQVWRGDDRTLKTIHAGMEVEIEGVSSEAGHAPGILPETLQVLGQKALPPPRPMVPVQFFSGSDECERIGNVRGVVQGYSFSDGGWVLLLNANPGIFIVKASSAVLKNPETLVDAEVCLSGVVGAVFNSRGELLMPKLLISEPEDIVVEKPAPSSPFDAPKVGLDDLLPFHPKLLKPHRKLVEGIVTYAQAGKVFYLQDGDSAVRVQSLKWTDLKPGDQVEVAGFVDMQRKVAGLTGAVIRKIGTTNVPAPVITQPGQILATVAQAEATGQTAHPSDFDGHLIQFRGRLLDVQPLLNAKPPGCQLTLGVGDIVTEAVLQSGSLKTLESLQIGSLLQLEGVVQLDYSGQDEEQDEDHIQPVGLEILLRSANDVSVLQSPPWWTPRRLLGLLAIGAVGMGGVLLWSWQLRRQLYRKTKELAVEMHARRDAAIEFDATLRERNRLAANLHDTLLQTISGLNFQLMACESESLPSVERKANHLETARRMVQRAQDDLRGTVWALRVLPLRGLCLGDAIQALGEKLAEERQVTIVVQVENEIPPLSEFVAGNLLLVSQEAIQNAIKHAHATSINVRVGVGQDRQHITLRVRDDGVGFDPLARPRPHSGHFGLEGMRERIERLGGKLRLESSEGHGTQVRAEVPLRAYDDEFDEP